MNKDRYQRVAEVFHEASNLTGEARDAFLERVCAGDAQLRRDVELLLDHDHAGGDILGDSRPGVGRGWLAAAVWADSESPSATSQPPAVPERVGQYRILQRIGEGGMGTVYAAEQDHPQRRVALKMIRPRVLSRGMLRRFQQEADLLGRLQHPGIAQIYEAGAIDTDFGRQPYFAMEYVDGVELRAYATQHELGTRGRLELVARICDAVHHAHQKGIIHRDLKPDNILVMDEPTPIGLTQQAPFAKLGQPKVLDFGVARATDSDIQLTTMHTDVGQLVGTVSYMSPEQVGGDVRDLDTRSDIYALGVILYELLTGRLPFDVRNRSIPEAARMVLEEEPTRVGSIRPVLRGDIDTIVSKALEKDPARRYPSAAELAADLRHYLALEPITAHPPSTFYQLRKFARRNRGLVAGLGLAILVLIAGVISSLEFAMRAARSESAARRAAYRSSLMAAEALGDTDPLQALAQLEAAPEEYRGWEWRHLTARHSAPVVAYSGDASANGFATIARQADGALVAALARDGAIDLIDLESGATCGGFRDQHALTTPSLSPRGSHLAAVAREAQLLIVWEVSTGKRVLELPIGSIVAASTKFSPDGSLLAAISDEGMLTIHETATGVLRAQIAILKSLSRRKVEFDAQGKRVVAVGQNYYGQIGLSIFSTDGTRLASARSEDGCRSLAFSPDGSLLAVGQDQRKILLLDASTLDVREVLHGHALSVTALVFSSDGTYLASSSRDGTTRIWDLREMETVRVLTGGGATALAFSLDGALLAAGSSTGAQLWSWSADARLVLRGHQSFVYYAAFNPDVSLSGLIASSAWDDTVRLWDALTGEPLAVLPAKSPWGGMSFTPDGSRLLARDNSAAGDVAVWDSTTGVRLASPRTASDTELFDTLRHQETDWSVRLVRSAQGGVKCYTRVSSPDKSLLAEVAGTGIRVTDVAAHKQVIQVNQPMADYHAIAFDPTGTRLATCRGDREIKIWDLDTGAELASLDGHVGEVYALVFSPDGSRLVSGGNDGNIIFWDAGTFERVALLRGHESYIYSLSFSPDGTMLASASGDGTIRIWDSGVPAKRWRQIRRATQLQSDAEPLVERLLSERGNPLDVADQLRADERLDESFRGAALRVLLRKSAAVR